MELGPTSGQARARLQTCWPKETRARIRERLTEPYHNTPARDAQLHMPLMVSEYPDFICGPSARHEYVGAILRGRANLPRN